jgi:hypothetical protein
VLFHGNPKSAPAGNCRGTETDSRAKFGKETVAGSHRRPKWVPHYGAQADSRRAQHAQAPLRLCSGSAQACSPSAQVYSPSAQVSSPSAQVKAAVAHVRRLKRNQRLGKLILSLWVSRGTKLYFRRLPIPPLSTLIAVALPSTDLRIHTAGNNPATIAKWPAFSTGL